jgi:TrmH family RNA methyltransferase
MSSRRSVRVTARACSCWKAQKPILELVQSAPQRIVCLIVTPSFLDRQPPEVRQQVSDSGCTVHSCPEHTLAQLSDVETSTGVLAIVHQPSWNQSAILAQPRIFGLYGDMLQDPTNMGTIIRTAAGLNVSASVVGAPFRRCVQPESRAGPPPARSFSCPSFLRPVSKNCRTWIAPFMAADAGTSEGCVPIRAIRSIPARTVLAIGSESRGLSEPVLDAATVRFHYPAETGGRVSQCRGGRQPSPCSSCRDCRLRAGKSDAERSVCRASVSSRYSSCSSLSSSCCFQLIAALIDVGFHQHFMRISPFMRPSTPSFFSAVSFTMP